MRLSESQLVFLARFAKSPEGREFADLMRAELADVEAKLRTCTGEEVYRQQGHAQRLDKILSDLAEASQRLSATQSAARPRRLVNLKEFGL
jgi:flagellar hook-basal body complex protein FliE